MEIPPITPSIHHLRRLVFGPHHRHLLANDKDKILVLHSVRDRWIMYVREYLFRRRNKVSQLTIINHS